MLGISIFEHILKTDGIPGLYQSFGTSAIGSLPVRVLALTSLEISKDMMLKYTEGLDIAKSSLIILMSCELHVTVNFNHHSKYGVQFPCLGAIGMVMESYLYFGEQSESIPLFMMDFYN